MILWIGAVLRIGAALAKAAHKAYKVYKAGKKARKAKKALDAAKKAKNKFPKKKPGCTQGCTKATTPSKLNPEQAKNFARFSKKLPKGAKNIQVKDLPNGGKKFSAEVPGKVPGSKAVYEKTIDAAGKTTEYLKTTYDPAGKIVHIKQKF